MPLYPSTELAQITGALLTDGHVDWYVSDGSPRTRKIILYSSNEEECEWFSGLVKKVFAVEPKITAYLPKYGQFKLQPYKAVLNNSVVAQTMILLGVCAGDKTKCGYKVPEWILNGNKKIKAAFLKTVFTFDGSKPYKRKNTWTISYSTTVTKEALPNGFLLFKQLNQLLKEFGVTFSSIPTAHLKENGKFMLISSASSRESITNFLRNLGYLNENKQRRLAYAVAEIFKLARIRSPKNNHLLSKFKKIFGTDKETAFFVNKLLKTKYTKRQFEHFRRNETMAPLEILALALKKTKTKNYLPDWAKFLHSHYLSLVPLMNSSTISLAADGE
ncbi:MAG: hypothetical protein V1494_06365 [Candidatus Diapherotrites archaeon]